MLCELDSSGFEIRWGQEAFLFSTSAHTAPATNPLFRKMGTCALSWDEATGHGDEHPKPYSAKKSA